MSYARAPGGWTCAPGEHRQRTRTRGPAPNHHGRQQARGAAPVAGHRAVACGTVGYVRFRGMWRSLVSAPALGAGGRRFESGHPDQLRAHVDLCKAQYGSQTGSHVLAFRVWPITSGARTARTRSILSTPQTAVTRSITAAAKGDGAAQSHEDLVPTESASAVRSVAGPRRRSRTISSSSMTNCGRGSARHPDTPSSTLSMTFWPTASKAVRPRRSQRTVRSWLLWPR